MSCRNTDPIRRSWIGHERWELRHRLAFTDCGTGRHGDRHAEEFNRRFHQICSNWIISFNGVGDSAADFRVNWVGDIGVTVCKAGMHGAGRAFDLSHIRAGNGAFIDTNTDWNPDSACRGLRATRRYIAVAASLRRFVGTVLTGWYNDDHKNHIHFDNGVRLAPIRRDLRTDTTLIQATCRYMNGEQGLAIDGAWGPATEEAYRRLRRALGMQCRSPRRNLTDARLFLQLIALNGMAGVRAGVAYSGPC